MQPDTSESRAPGRAIVACRGLSKIYTDGAVEVRAVDGLDLDIAAGDFATLSGPSGSGKTTLQNMIGGLDRPTSGSVTVDGEDLSSLNTAHLAELRLHKIGFVFQAYNLIPVLSALENIEFVLQLLGVGAKERRARAASALADVGLAGMEGRRPSHLSGGQQQRVAVARALVARPAIVLADEPTANLDSKSADDLISLMAELNARSGTTFLIGTHDARVIARARRHIEMVDGKVTADTTGDLADVAQ
ncbi:macrolide ABC transporter ATP-binding protein [Defluviimonas sp. 20V17]|uniref:ABC transport system ATP-binding protein n=1 Tax=Allgaiera indica TaxID=765699 RepID=A0AAN5A118_9RHOB|nr:ABC transporter ATP-binding protein [Allgaiera indica]KDB04960.1 macrolide ABC transporter ATP-binding protein [Defluviimonas sp. 20V17]GHE05402.1 ABC transporter ATP-binding protein [Allgaiera indica]SDX72696.1 putative ABC transport system ATP-binding protein [Allgaiera indica]